MQRRDFRYTLPAELIAQQPPTERGASRLLYLNAGTGRYRDRRFADIVELVSEADLMVFNDTKVIPARLRGRKQSGGQVEVLVERVLDDRRVLAQVRASKTPKAGTLLLFDKDVAARVQGRDGEFFTLEFDTDGSVMAVLERIGRVPLPPYIQREAKPDDERRYQTVYAAKPGAVAAPTAGLHFDEALLNRLRDRGVELAYLTLHVGAGTFQPVRVDDLSQHRMHSEWIEVSEELVAQVDATRRRGGKVIAIGTTVVRSLESAARGGQLVPYRGETDIFITPGFEFRVVDALLTNFHLPESTLLMLVCAFGGYDNIMRAYRHAVEQRYRFFSYGDAMYIERET